MVTIKEIAKECGISATAVSKALRNEKDISQATIEKVKKTAKEMGYIKNPAAVRLKTNRSYTFGVLMEDGTQSGITHEFFASILNSFIIHAREKGYTVTFISDKLGNETLSYEEYVRVHGCDGVLILVHEFEDDKILNLVKSEVPVVVVDYSYSHCSAVNSDNEHAIREMVHYAYEMGHSKIAFIHGEITMVTKIRIASFYKTCDELGIPINEDYIKEGVYHDPKSAEEITYELLSMKEPPTFIFYQDDFAFIGGLNAFENKNIEIPKDISVAGFDGMSLSQVIRPKLMTWKQNGQEMGREAVGLLIEAVEKPKSYIPRIVEVRGELLKGKSVKNIQGSTEQFNLHL